MKTTGHDDQLMVTRTRKVSSTDTFNIPIYFLTDHMTLLTHSWEIYAYGHITDTDMKC